MTRTIRLKNIPLIDKIDLIKNLLEQHSTIEVTLTIEFNKPIDQKEIPSGLIQYVANDTPFERDLPEETKGRLLYSLNFENLWKNIDLSAIPVKYDDKGLLDSKNFLEEPFSNYMENKTTNDEASINSEEISDINIKYKGVDVTSLEAKEKPFAITRDQRAVGTPQQLMKSGDKISVKLGKDLLMAIKFIPFLKKKITGILRETPTFDYKNGAIIVNSSYEKDFKTYIERFHCESEKDFPSFPGYYRCFKMFTELLSSECVLMEVIKESEDALHNTALFYSYKDDPKNRVAKVRNFIRNHHVVDHYLLIKGKEKNTFSELLTDYYDNNSTSLLKYLKRKYRLIEMKMNKPNKPNQTTSSTCILHLIEKQPGERNGGFAALKKQITDDYSTIEQDLLYIKFQFESPAQKDFIQAEAGKLKLLSYDLSKDSLTTLFLASWTEYKKFFQNLSLKQSKGMNLTSLTVVFRISDLKKRDLKIEFDPNNTLHLYSGSFYKAVSVLKDTIFFLENKYLLE